MQKPQSGHICHSIEAVIEDFTNVTPVMIMWEMRVLVNIFIFRISLVSKTTTKTFTHMDYTEIFSIPMFSHHVDI